MRPAPVAARGESTRTTPVHESVSPARYAPAPMPEQSVSVSVRFLTRVAGGRIRRRGITRCIQQNPSCQAAAGPATPGRRISTRGHLALRFFPGFNPCATPRLAASLAAVGGWGTATSAPARRQDAGETAARMERLGDGCQFLELRLGGPRPWLPARNLNAVCARVHLRGHQRVTPFLAPRPSEEATCCSAPGTRPGSGSDSAMQTYVVARASFG